MKRRWAAAALASLAVASACSTNDSPRPTGTETQPPRVLLFTRTTGFKHSSIPGAVSALESALKGKATVVTTGDPAGFTDAGLAPYRVVVFLLTTGDVLNAEQQSAFERFVGAGGGFAGIHSATDTEYGWPWYHQLIGATFKRHPRVQSGVLRIADANHPSMLGLPSPWTRTEEWYDFRANPRSKVHVLATVDESSYRGGTMGSDHPIAWCRSAAGGHVWYTAMGHGAESWSDAVFLQHVAGGILSVSGGGPKSCS